MLLIIIPILVVIYYVISHPHKYWITKGVKQGKTYPLLGSNWKVIMRKESFADIVQTNYYAVPNVRYSGMYQFFTPILVLKDPDLIKQITVKDFDHFVDHRTLIPTKNDPLWSRNLLALHGNQWREMRSILSPAFTSSKMKYMFTLISQSGEQFINHFLKKTSNVIEIEMKDIFTRYTNDVIANTAFGVECNSLGERENEFYLKGQEATNLSGFWKNLKIFGYMTFPQIFKNLDVKLFSKEVSDFFTKLIKINIETREKHNIVRPDLIHLLLEARKLGLNNETSPNNVDIGLATAHDSEITKSSTIRRYKITDIDIVAQALVFFIGGFDSVAALMCFTGYELAVNPDVQQKLIKEVDDTRKACNGKLSYDALLNMKYMDMVISESLRKWPNSVAIDRVCTKPYTIEPKTPDENPVHLKINDIVWIPIFGLHRDPKNFPEPEKFIPERFNDKNKEKIKPYTYLPFGSGPRNCIGSRFALLETKTLFFYILSNFEIVPTKKSTIPLKLNPKSINMTVENGFWFGFKQRNIL